MIGFVYNGKAEYITRIEDFRDYMDSAVYEALIRALDSGITSERDADYQELKQDYDNLLEEYDDLESECDNLRDEVEENEECRSKLEEMKQKYESFHHSIKVLINELYLGYVQQEDIISTLEKLV